MINLREVKLWGNKNKHLKKKYRDEFVNSLGMSYYPIGIDLGLKSFVVTSKSDIYFSVFSWVSISHDGDI